MPALELTLPQIAQLQPDGTISFNAAKISTIASSTVAFMIFYLTQTDEQNGYGTVIQLDEQHQAHIYPDLNPEYTYLFFQNELGFQTLLWCIEFATRTDDSLYITQAKVHGRGVTEEDMQRFNQITLPAQPGQMQSPHTMAESYQTASHTTQSTNSTLPAPPVPSTTTPVLPSAPLVAAADPIVAVDPAMPDLLAPIDTEAVTPSIPVDPPVILPGLPAMPEPGLAPQMDQSLSQPANFPDLPPLPDLPSLTPLVQPPIPPIVPAVTGEHPELVSPSQEEAKPMDPPPVADFAKNPVGRPLKPLLAETTWTVDQEDFAWAKSISRDPIQANQTQLRQKINQQIQRNQPELLTNPAFQSAFDAAFAAVCQTYDLTPTARQDILKSLLNGRIIESIAQTLVVG